MIMRSRLAKKYAVAFLNATQALFDKQWIESVVVLDRFFKTHKALYLLLGSPTIASDIKIGVLEKMFDRLSINNSIRMLVHVLFEHRRLHILRQVICHVIDEQRIQNNIVLFSVSSSRPLTPYEQKLVIGFLEQKTHAQVAADFVLEQELIAGIRAQSDTFLWEQSIACYLQHVEQAVLRQVAS